VRFTEVTKAASLSGFKFISGTTAKDYIIEAPGSGCALLDYDNDGWQNLLAANGHIYPNLDEASWGDEL
jgi:enediyne biosynthesis protein E4